MVLQMPRVRECLAADFTAKRRLAGVNHRVHLQARPSQKLLVTEFACEGTHPRMLLCMPSQIAQIREALAADFADEWLLGGMNLDVSLQSGVNGELFTADLTGEWLISGMNPHVSSQPVRLRKLLVTDFAAEKLPFR